MNKDLSYYMNLPYREVIESDPAGGYVGHIPALRGCVTQAETRSEVLAMLDDAKACWLEAALAAGIDIPEPPRDEDFSGRFNLRLPKSLHRQLAQEAKREGVSLNQLALTFIARGLCVSAER